MPSARKRRAELAPSPPAPGSGGAGLSFLPPKNTSTPSTPPVPTGPMTIQQAIAFTNSRLATLERSVNEQISNIDNKLQTTISGNKGGIVASSPAMDELYSRFDIVVNELADLKDNFTKLQTYTMEVNRILMEDYLRNTKTNTTDIEYPSFLTAAAAPEISTAQECVAVSSEETQPVEENKEVSATTPEFVPPPPHSIPPVSSVSRRRGGPGKSMDVR